MAKSAKCKNQTFYKVVVYYAILFQTMQLSIYLINLPGLMWSTDPMIRAHILPKLPLICIWSALCYGNSHTATSIRRPTSVSDDVLFHIAAVDVAAPVHGLCFWGLLSAPCGK